MLTFQAEVYGNETFHCERCGEEFHALVAEWVDAARTPQVKALLQEWKFNIVTCPRCGNRHFSMTSFFYEDFAEGLLVAVFPEIPANRASLEEDIRRLYGHYPVLEFFYDMSQLWFLIYLQRHYTSKEASRSAARIGTGEERLRRFLSFLKTDPLMLSLSEALMNSLRGKTKNDDLQNILWRALAKIEGDPLLPPDAGARSETGRLR